MHSVLRYTKTMRMLYVVFSKGKNGTTRFNRMATIHCVMDGSRLAPGAEVVRRIDDIV